MFTVYKMFTTGLKIKSRLLSMLLEAPVIWPPGRPPMAGLRRKPARTVNCAYLKDAQECSWEREQESRTKGGAQKPAKMP